MIHILVRVAVAAAMFLAVQPSNSAQAQPSTSSSPRTVFLIMMENHNWSDIQGNTSAPYINGLLRRRDASYATQYYTPPSNHPSLPNYLWLESGTNFGIGDDNPPSDHRLSSRTHLATLLEKSRISWRAYEEGIDGRNCPLFDRGSYAVRHDPFVYFTDVALNTGLCRSHVRPFTQFGPDLAGGRVARYNFITPDVCHDMHDTCAPENDPVSQGDHWLARVVPRIVTSNVFKQGGVLFLVWDEGAGDSDGPLPMIVLSPFSKGQGYHNRIHYTHSSTLRTIEEILHIRPLLGNASQAVDLHDLFRVFP